MADENNQAETPVAGNSEEAGAQEIRFSVQKIFVKDSSYEAPGSPESFRQPYSPKVDLSINTKSRKIEDNVYEVILRLTTDVKQDDKQLFLAEVQQGGVFLIQGLEGDRLNQVINISCPNVLFPYGREAIDSLIIKGGFPALMLAPMNFESLYMQAKEAQGKQQAEANAAPIVDESSH